MLHYIPINPTVIEQNTLCQIAPIKILCYNKVKFILKLIVFTFFRNMCSITRLLNLRLTITNVFYTSLYETKSFKIWIPKKLLRSFKVYLLLTFLSIKKYDGHQHVVQYGKQMRVDEVTVVLLHTKTNLFIRKC